MNPFSYQGRVGRLKYFFSILIVSIISYAIVVLLFVAALSFLIGGQLSEQRPSPTVFILGFFGMILLAFLVPIILSSAFIVKRFHDLGKPGTWWFALLIPIYNIHLALGLLIERGTVGPNQYGEDPLPPTANPNDLLHRLSQNKFFRVAIVVLILLLSIFASGNKRQAQQNAQQEMINQITNTPDYSGWLTYQDSASHLSFMHPPDYKVQKQGSEIQVYPVALGPAYHLVAIDYVASNIAPASGLANLATKGLDQLKANGQNIAYTISTAQIAGQPAQKITLTEPQQGATYYFEAAGNTYSVIENYDIATKVTPESIAADTALSEKIVQSMTISGK